MDDAPKLNAYIVAIAFADGGPLYVNAMIAPHESVAAAGVATEFFQKEGGGTTKPLLGVSVGQLTPEFLRMALQAHERGLDPSKPNVVALRDSLIRAAPDAYEMGQRAAELLRSDEPHRDAGYTDPSWPHPPQDPAA